MFGDIFCRTIKLHKPISLNGLINVVMIHWNLHSIVKQLLTHIKIGVLSNVRKNMQMFSRFESQILFLNFLSTNQLLGSCIHITN